MRNYELMYIINKNVDDEQRPAVIEKYKQIILDNGGEVANVEEWGMRRLAYEVKKNREGYYVLMNFKSSTEACQELERLIKIDEAILKHLVVRHEDEKVS
ncbi:MAG TPA: 30S ribosomal protein S6 [Clostridia bacterium]|jgi:small subunit ribosomal protein S6|nr:30S ribosomal protein S6 [Clostridia bacterium]